MIRYFLTLFLTVVLFSVQANSSKELFDIDYASIQNEISDLNNLEMYVSNHEGVTLSGMQAENNILSMNISNSPAMMPAFSGTMADVPAFLWGFCLGPIGVVIVWIIDEDDLLMSVVGCLVSSFLYGGGYLLAY